MKKHLYISLLSIAFLILSRPLFAQDYLVDYTYLGSRTKTELYFIFFQPVDYDIDLYKIRYKTLDANNEPDTASGLIVLPQGLEPVDLPIVVYGHGTTDGPTDVPSELKGGYQVAMAYAASGFVAVAPDYVGLGDSRGFHPYIHAATEAAAMIDMIFASFEYLDPNYIPTHLFLSGYSQGGHASMATHAEIEDVWSFIIPVTAATHMSGPYSVSGVMRDRVLSDVSYGYPSYISYIFLSYNEVYDLYDNVDEVLKEPYASDIDSFYNRQINLATLNQRLISSLVAIEGDTVAKKMLQDSIVTALSSNLNHPLNVALRDNDTYNWAPVAPTRLYYCGGDTQVPSQNAIIADSVMNALGATDLHAINLNNDSDHGLCVVPAITNSIAFFKSFLNPSSIEQLDKKAKLLKVSPNPSMDQIILDWDKAKFGCEYQIMNMNGVVVSEGKTSSNRISIDKLANGIYMIACTVGEETRIARMMRL